MRPIRNSVLAAVFAALLLVLAAGPVSADGGPGAPQGDDGGVLLGDDGGIWISGDDGGIY